MNSRWYKWITILVIYKTKSTTLISSPISWPSYLVYPLCFVICNCTTSQSEYLCNEYSLIQTNNDFSTVYPRRSDPFHIVSYYIKWVTIFLWHIVIYNTKSTTLISSPISWPSGPGPPWPTSLQSWSLNLKINLRIASICNNRQSI